MQDENNADPHLIVERMARPAYGVLRAAVPLLKLLALVHFGLQVYPVLAADRTPQLSAVAVVVLAAAVQAFLIFAASELVRLLLEIREDLLRAAARDTAGERSARPRRR